MNFHDPKFYKHLSNPDHSNHDKIIDFLICLAVCHTIIIDHNKEKDEYTYSASSPDELALVNAAKMFGYEFKSRSVDNILEIQISKYPREKGNPDKTEVLEFELLNILEFDSDRKRMSAIVKCPNGEIKVMCKGADSVLMKRITDD